MDTVIPSLPESSPLYIFTIPLLAIPTALLVDFLIIGTLVGSSGSPIVVIFPLMSNPPIYSPSLIVAAPFSKAKLLPTYLPSLIVNIELLFLLNKT